MAKSKKQNEKPLPTQEIRILGQPIISKTELDDKTLFELDELDKNLYFDNINNRDLLASRIKVQAADTGVMKGRGVLEILDKEAYLRLSKNNYLPNKDDIFVNSDKIKRYNLRTGHEIDCTIDPNSKHGEYLKLLQVQTVSGKSYNELIKNQDRNNESIYFYNLESIYPDERLVLEHDPQEYSTRIIDLVSPIGKGQRGLVIAPPRAGKTTMLCNIAHGIEKNYPDMLIIFLLIDERPEEVTKIKRSINGEIISSTFDEDPDRHLQVADMTIEKAKRYAEHGKDVIIFLDSITRYVRALNVATPGSGRILSGGIDSKTLIKPRKFFGAARNLEGSGSLTIMASALVGTNSRGDDIICEDLKGTANMEICLSQDLLDDRIFPTIDIKRSKTREEELLLDPVTLRKVSRYIKQISSGKHVGDITAEMIAGLQQYKHNVDFVKNMKGVF